MPKDEKNSKPRRDKYVKRKGRGGKGQPDDNDSDSSVDSHGNLRGLISYDSSSESDAEEEIIIRSRRRPPTRKAALVAKTKITRLIQKEDRRKKKPSVPLPPLQRRRRPSFSTEEEKTDVSMSEEEILDETEEDSDEMQQDEEEEDEEEDKDEEEAEEADEDADEDEEEESFRKGLAGAIFSAMLGGKGNEVILPKKHKMKQESELVNRFVKLVTTPVEENTIDNQIDQFKGLTEEKQREMVAALERRSSGIDSGMDLMLKLLTLRLPAETQAMLLAKYTSLQSLDPSSNEYYKLRAWLEKVASVPFGTYKEIPVRLDDGSDRCGDFMRGARKCLDNAVYGQEDTKLQILQFIGTKIANPAGRGLSLLFVGPPGVGKTSIIKNGIAKALGWPFQFISLGGDSDASTYIGHQLVYESSHCGKIVNSLVASKSMSTVLMFDEIDKISQTPKGEEVMNLLIHLTDPVQNGDFEDKYLSGIPIDLSKVMFVFSANDIHKIDKILLDRMIVVQLKGYDLKEKTVIAEQYLLPESLREVNLTEKVSISREILTMIIQEYSGDEKGVRELKRCIDRVVQKINMLRIYNSPDLPFHIKDFSLPFIVKKDHVRLFLKKREEDEDRPPHGMYL